MTIDKWTDENGFKFEIVNVQNSHLCGYITVPEGHPWRNFGPTDYAEAYYIDVHGGITFIQNGTLGFDCNHWGDRAVPKDQDFVRDELQKLARQAKEEATS
jgi:hypothetical protein